jgi:predicted esterase
MNRNGFLRITAVALVLALSPVLVPRLCQAAQLEKYFTSRSGETNVRIGYLLSLPAGYSRAAKAPMILFLHGSGERGTNLEAVKAHGPPKLVGQGRLLQFVVVSPQCPPDSDWDAPGMLTALGGLVDEVVRQYGVDAERIYLTGLSMGGFGTWSLASRFPGRFAAIAPVCGGGNSGMSAVLGNIPVWIFHGARDPVVPVSRATEMISNLASSDPNMKSTIYPELGHDSWTATYGNPDLYLWMLGWKKGAVKTVPALDPAAAKEFETWSMDYHYNERIDDSVVVFSPGEPMAYTLNRKNYSDKNLQETVRWVQGRGLWTAKPAIMGINLRPGESRTVHFSLAYNGGRNDFTPPSWSSDVFLGPERWRQSTRTVRLDADGYFLKNPLVADCVKIARPAIDGDLSDPAWKKARVFQDFRRQDTSAPARYRTAVRTGYDKERLYVSISCEQSNLSSLVTAKTEDDANLWEDDSVEVFIAPVPGQTPYYQFVVNSAGFVYDADVWDRDWDAAGAEIQTSLSGTAWTVEMSVPLATLGVTGRKGGQVGFEVSRNHKYPPESSQWCPTFDGNHAFARYGRLVLK